MPYKNFQQLKKGAETNYESHTTAKAERKGLARVAPPGMKPRKSVVQHYAQDTGKKAAQKWLNHWVQAEYTRKTPKNTR